MTAACAIADGADGARPQAVAPPPRVLALLTSHNRRMLTQACLQSLDQAGRQSGVALEAVLVDDGSTDGTAEAVARQFAWVTVLAGSGDLYWCRGMHQAMAVGLQRPVDFLLWLNDDTVLRPDALQRLLQQHQRLSGQHGRPVAVVGATAGPDGRLSYGGAVAINRLRRFQFRPVWDAVEAVACEAMNGNCVLLPVALARAVGNIDPAFEHAMGDTDYALRLRAAGFALYVAPGFVGDCANNPPAGGFDDRSLPLRRRWQVMMGRKGLPWRSWLHFTRRHGGPLWPLYFGWPYLRVLLTASSRPRRPCGD
jgi:GT2 family glycosyltransferase